MNVSDQQEMIRRQDSSVTRWGVHPMVSIQPIHHASAMVPTIKSFPSAPAKPISDEKFHRRAVDSLSHVILAAAAVLFIAEVIITWSR